MKIVCLSEIAVPPAIMMPMKELEQHGAEVVIVEDSTVQTAEAFFGAMKKIEEQHKINGKGAEAWPAEPSFVAAVKDADIIVVHVSPVNQAVLDAAEKLKYVAVLRSGIENVRQDICAERGIEVINAPGRSAPAVADCTLALMLAEMKNIARAHANLMQGKWVTKYANAGNVHDLCNCTVGIIGAGLIGRKVIDRLRGFESNIIVHDPFMSDDDLKAMGYTPVGLEALLRESDIVSLHLRQSEQTKHFIGKAQLDMMKPTAILVNTARPGIIDETALVQALKNKTIGGAALDVFANEPLNADDSLLALDNVTLTPHLAGTSADTCPNSVKIIKEELMKLL